MGWKKHTLCFRLLSPLHIGYRKVGNLMQTRGYVPGKNLWAALTARLTRDFGNGADGARYVSIGNDVNEAFRFGYLYPTLPKAPAQTIESVHDLDIHYPWDDLFDYRFLSSYASTALNYEHWVAAEGLLHEVEFVHPWAQALSSEDQPLPVYLVGELYVQDKLKPELTGWHAALKQLQIGGEQGYGWGRLRLELPQAENGITAQPNINVAKDKPVLAHVQAENVGVVGPVEPLVGWERNNKPDRKSNWHLSSATICYAPGATVTQDTTFAIGPYGIWQRA